MRTANHDSFCICVCVIVIYVHFVTIYLYSHIFGQRQTIKTYTYYCHTYKTCSSWVAIPKQVQNVMKVASKMFHKLCIADMWAYTHVETKQSCKELSQIYIIVVSSLCFTISSGLAACQILVFFVRRFFSPLKMNAPRLWIPELGTNTKCANVRSFVLENDVWMNQQK